MKRKLIFFDIDNTLISHAGKSHIPGSTTETVRLLKQNGHIVAIATARNLCMTRKTAVHFEMDLLVCCDGAHVVYKGRTLHDEWLNPNFIRAFRESQTEAPENFWALDAEYIYTARGSEKFTDYLIEQTGFDCRRPAGELQQAYMAYSVFPLTFDCGSNVNAITSPAYTEFLPRGTTKWSGILKAAETLNCSEDDIITVGDGLNDLEMIQNASLGIAVGRSDDRLKAVADIVASDIDEGGIFEAFKKLNMI